MYVLVYVKGRYVYVFTHAYVHMYSLMHCSAM